MSFLHEVLDILTGDSRILREWIIHNYPEYADIARYCRAITPAFLLSRDPQPAWKETLTEREVVVADAELFSSKVTKGEFWEINNIYGSDSVAGDMLLEVVRGIHTYPLKDDLNVKSIAWSGSILLDEDSQIRVSSSSTGNMTLYLVGVKRYA